MPIIRNKKKRHREFNKERRKIEINTFDREKNNTRSALEIKIKADSKNKTLIKDQESTTEKEGRVRDSIHERKGTSQEHC